MFACTELVTGYDDYGKIIFLQSDCRQRKAANEPTAGRCSCMAAAHADGTEASKRICPSCLMELFIDPARPPEAQLLAG